LNLGLGFLAWGTVGLLLSNQAEKKLGFEPSESDKEALEKIKPRISVVER
jgi:hypothetical protein